MKDMSLLLTLVACTVLVIAAVAMMAVWLHRHIRREINSRARESDDRDKTLLSVVEHRLRRLLPLSDDAHSDWVVIATRNRMHFLQRAIESIRSFEPAARILVVDTGSDDGTAIYLDTITQSGVIDRYIRHSPNSVPQWQKGYALSEAMMLLQLTDVRTMTVLDDDMEISGAWLQTSRALLDSESNVAVVNLHDDPTQQTVHTARKDRVINGRNFVTTSTFNGAAFVMSASTLRRWGMPPVGEGINDTSVEDWYYSRCAQREKAVIVLLPLSIHHGYSASLREMQ